ncbi:MAG: T9SS C-terminal target domain-containing protein [Ignavibacteriales bacterium]|jgi:hypothetical protein|nr:MAG: T9SS C-terminal target domain-containing protein [Ignavibacteriales bacterium]
MKKHLIISLTFGLSMYAQIFTGLAPLKVGNSWTYVENYFGNNPEYEKHTVVDSNVQIGDQLYYKVESKHDFGSGTRYYAVVDSYYVKHDTHYDNSNFRYFPVSPTIGEWNQFYYAGSDSGALRSEIADLFESKVFGIDVIVYSVIRELGLAGSGEYWTQEFGRLYYMGEFVEYTLTGCIVDGVEYGDTTLVSVEYDKSLPKEIVLSQNYPNPFNPTTTIEYYLPTSSKVRLVIYNSLGQEVETLVSEFQTSGEHRVQFNARGYSTGVYFYSLITESNLLTKKMLLIK